MEEKRRGGGAADARARFETMVRGGVFKPVERFVCRDHDAEDRVAEGLGGTWKWYARQVALGREPDLALIRHCCRMRTIDRSHRLDSGDRSHWLRDVYQVQGRHGVELRRLQLVDDEDDRVDQDAALGLAEAGAQDPTPKLDSALDLQGWLGTLSARDRTMLAMRNAGHGLVAIGNKLRCTSSTVHKHCRELGAELARRADIEIEPKRRRRRVPQGLTPALRDALAAAP
jgi:hypothetical protein